MKKVILSIIASVIAGIFLAKYGLNIEEENLVYKVSPPAYFGETVYQNLTIKNIGWNPATNVNVYASNNSVSHGSAKSNPQFDVEADMKNMIGGFERVRRNELVTISFVFKGEPLADSDVDIKSDRSIASVMEDEEINVFGFTLASFISAVAFWFLLGIISAIVIPQYKEYKQMAQKSADMMSNIKE